ncbi:hypothetical protein GCM10029992_20010 [Glycomyces albus]
MAHTYTASRAEILAALRADREHTGGHRMIALAIHIAMQRRDDQLRNPMQFRHSFGLARATDTDRPPGEILEQSFQQLLVRIRTVSGFRGWHPAFDWEEHLTGLSANPFVESLVRQGLFPERVTPHELLAVRAYLVLVSLWTREAVQRPQDQPDAEAEERYLDSVAAAETDAPVYPDQVAPAVRAAARALSARGASTTPSNPWWARRSRCCATASA